MDQTPPDTYKHTPEEPKLYLEKSAFVPAKPLPHSPKISPSSIPNPNPSVSTSKQIESGYPNYGGYLYSVPGYSAFQPVSYPSVIPPNQTLPIVSKNSEFTPYPLITKENQEPKNKEPTITSANIQTEKKDALKPQTDFEDHFKPEIIPASSLPGDSNIQISESKMSITSLAQGSGATVTVPSQIHHNSENKKKPIERFSLKTSIPISKIDLKCVNNTQESTQKKLPVPFHPAFQSTKIDNSKIEIQSNVVIKSGIKETNDPADTKQNNANQVNNISTLLNAAEAISKSDSQFRKPEPKPEAPKEIKDPPPFPNTAPNPQVRPLFNPLNIETKKASFTHTPTDATHGEQNNSILFIKNKTASNQKMVLAIQQQSPQVLLQRTNFESKNMLAPSRLSSQLKKSKDDSDSLSKVVALKRLHHENCDENDFENLITENQIYGNKIVVKEKLQGTLQEQDLKNKNKLNEKTQPDQKNVVLQPNFVYLSNLQFPANLMMLNNNSKNNQSNSTTKINKMLGKDIKVSTNEAGTMTNNDGLKLNNNNNKNIGKEIHLFNSKNNVLQSISNKNNNSDVVFQTNQKVIMNPQIVYQMPMIVDTENKINQPFNKDYPNMTGSKTDYSKPFDPSNQNDKLYIACPYQIDSKLQPKIVITNIRPKITKIDETSSLDLYEKKKRLRRLKHLTNRDSKSISKSEIKKAQPNIDHKNNIITPDKMKGEIYREFAETRVLINDESSSSDSEYHDDELNEYNEIIKQYGTANESDEGKEEFLANLNLGTHNLRKDKEMELQENILRKDSIASAYVAAGRLDRLCNEANLEHVNEAQTFDVKVIQNKTKESPIMLKKKQLFLSRLSLIQVNTQHKESFERTWTEIIKERSRRNNTDCNYILKAPKYVPEKNFNTNTQLQMLTEIKRSVNENNNLIKKRLDSACEEENHGDSIKVLAEKNFTELNRLSKMADRCVKLYSGQETKKRDLNPGFDSENIQKLPKIDQQITYPQINIPDISKIISLKSYTETTVVTSSQATSMDEPRSSAAGVSEMFTGENEKSREVGCQVEPTFTWTDLEQFMTNYKVYEAARKKEIADLHRRTTALRVECAHVTHAASCNSDRARALLAERLHLAEEERTVRASVALLTSAILTIRNY